ncbi:MAG: hypothetical protein EOO81_09935 [Oxalobacteraceae bacterium]|nr:MAG: hypothetical protein EOO81_09935 [Oxalobacteraceae bacterium]
MMRSVVAAAVIALTISQAAAAQEIGAFFTGDTLLALCSSADGHDQFRCLGYVEGLNDSREMFDNSQFGKRLCFPKGTTSGQLRDVVVRYLNEQPNMRRLLAAQLVFISLAGAYPCRP